MTWILVIITHVYGGISISNIPGFKSFPECNVAKIEIANTANFGELLKAVCVVQNSEVKGK